MKRTIRCPSCEQRIRVSVPFGWLCLVSTSLAVGYIVGGIAATVAVVWGLR